MTREEYIQLFQLLSKYGEENAAERKPLIKCNTKEEYAIEFMRAEEEKAIELIKSYLVYEF